MLAYTMLAFFVITFLNNECSLLAKKKYIGPMTAAEFMVSAMVVFHWFVVISLRLVELWLVTVIDIFCGPSLVESLGHYMVNLVIIGVISGAKLKPS